MGGESTYKKIISRMERYIITTEDGTHFVTKEVSRDELVACREGYLTIIRTTDMTEYNPNGDVWEKIQIWEGY